MSQTQVCYHDFGGDIFFVISVKITIPIIGRELMPPMDTGIMKIFFLRYLQVQRYLRWKRY